MKPTRVISFDMDGTLTDLSFVDSVWLEGIPKLFAQNNQISLEEARKRVKSEYDRVGNEKLEWYDLNYWLDKFSIDASPQQVLKSFREKIRVFQDVPTVLENLKNRGYRLIVITNARREFVDIEMQQTGIQGFFERIFSSPSDFRLTKNATRVYEKVCIACEISPCEMIHVGDDQDFDFEVPKKLGINAFLLDRTGTKTGTHTISSLEEFERKIIKRFT